MRIDRRGWIISRRILGGLVGLSSLALFSISLHGMPLIFADAEVPVSLDIDTVLSLTITPEEGLSVPLLPNVTGAFSAKTLMASVATNNLTGFKLTFSAGEGGTALINSANNETNTLPSTSGGLDSGIPVDINTWGFGVPMNQADNAGLLPNDSVVFDGEYPEVESGPRSYSPYAGLPTYGSPITLKQTSSLSTSSDDSLVSVGALINTAKPAGAYRGTVVFTAIGNYVARLPSMQAFSNEDCARMSFFDTIELEDIRDGRIYTITSVSGKCVMAENLAFGDVANSTTLTPQDSNVTSEWVLPSAISNGTESSYEPAQWIPANADSGTYCDSGDCGNLYNWFAATAGTGAPGTPTQGSATNSVCPAGWTLDNDEGLSWIVYVLSGYELGASDDIRDTAFVRNEPFRAALSGTYDSGFVGRGTEGYIWSSRPSNYDGDPAGTPDTAYSLMVSMSQATLSRLKISSGAAVRCMLIFTGET